MSLRSLIIIGLIILAGQAEAHLQYVFVTDTVDQFGNQWTVKGGVGDQITVLNDGVDGQYIFSKSTADTNRYTIEGIATYDYERLDVIDSIQIHLWSQDFQVGGTAIMRVGCAINTDISWVTLTELGGSWGSVTQKGSFTTPPGSRGTWDKSELDSVNVLLNPTTITNDSIGVTACSVFVYTTLANPYKMFFTYDTSGCAPGANFSKMMDGEKPIVLDTVKIHVPILTSETDYFVSENGDPYNADWMTGGFKVRLNVIKNVTSAVNSDSVRFRVTRLNSTCTAQESTPYTAWTFISGTGAKSIGIAAFEWTAGATGDLMQLEMQSRNFLSVSEDSLWFTVGINESRLDMDIPDGGGPAEYSGCLDLIDTLRVQDTTTNMQAWSRYNAYGFQKDTFQITAFQESYGTGAAAKVLSLTDRINGTAIFEVTATDTQRFTLDNTIASGTASISQIEATIWARRKTTGVTTTVRQRLMMNGSTNYCEGSDKTLNGIYASYVDIFTATPTGAGSCTGSLDSAALDSINIAFVATAVGANDTILVGQFDLYVCYSQVGGAPTPKRRRRIQMIQTSKEIDGAQEFARVCGFNADPIIGFVESGWLWQE